MPRQSQASSASCGGTFFGVIILVGVVAYLLTVVIDVFNATWPFLLGIGTALLAGHLIRYFRGDFIVLRVLKPKSWFCRGPRKGFIFLGIMLAAGLTSFAPARHVQLVKQHQAYLKEVAQQEALARQQQLEEARQAAEQAQREHEERQREADRKREEIQRERLRVAKAQAEAQAKAKQRAIDAARRAEEQRQWEAEQARRDQQRAAEKAAAAAQRDQEERDREAARRLEEGPYTSSDVSDMCWAAIKAKAAEAGLMANNGSNWGNYPYRWKVTRSWKWIPKVKLTSFTGQSVVEVECVVQDSGRVSTYFFD